MRKTIKKETPATVPADEMLEVLGMYHDIRSLLPSLKKGQVTDFEYIRSFNSPGKDRLLFMYTDEEDFDTTFNLDMNNAFNFKTQKHELNSLLEDLKHEKEEADRVNALCEVAAVKIFDALTEDELKALKETHGMHYALTRADISELRKKHSAKLVKGKRK